MSKNILAVRAAFVALILFFAGQASAAPAGAPGVVAAHAEGTPFEARTPEPQGGGAAQSPPAREGGATRVVVSGDALVQAQPDTAIITIAVVTQNASASEAQAENASKTEAVVRAVRAAAGPGAEVKTSGYSLQPQYVYREGAEPRISGYTARNAVTVTLNELPRVGAVIDAATRAGANNVDNLAFTLRRDQEARNQALAEATREALGKARLLAQTLGGRVVRIVEVQEGGTAVRPPIPLYAKAEMRGAVAGDAAAQTPIEIGTLDIRSEVQLVVEITATATP